jgi:biopolymer transport protein ExbB
VLLAGITARREGQNPETIGLRMESQARRRAEDLERNVSFLSSIANLATLLGLLGTVSGMLHAFLNLKISGVSDPARLAGGISEALITTVAGLCVAIPCLLCFHIFRQRVNRALTRMEIASVELLSLFTRERQLRPKS